MNIFISDVDPVISAQNLDDKRVVKMILESAQLLCTALHLNNASHLAKYKKTHVNHPSNIWVRETDSNYIWLLNHFEALCNEYTYRYNKVHTSMSLLDDLRKGAAYIPKGDLTPFANCAARSDMNIDFKSEQDITIAYQKYLIARWNTDKVKPRWSIRDEPIFKTIGIQC